MSKSNYSESVKKLRVFLKEQEKSRQNWAKESWSHLGGKPFKTSRILVPIISLIGFCAMVVLCVIKFMNIPQMQKAIIGKVLNTTVKEESNSVYFFFIIVFIALCALVFACTSFIKKNYKKASFWLFGSSFVLTVCSLLRYTADKGTFADNSNYDGAPTFTYFEICLFALIVFAVLLVISIILIAIIIKDKKEFDRVVENTLVNVIPKDKNADLLTEDDYSKLIDEYIEKKSKSTKTK